MLGKVSGAALRYVAEQKKLCRFTRDTSRGVLCVLLDFARSAGDIPVHRLTREHIEAWQLELDCAPGTARRKLSAVKVFCRWCVEHDLLRRDPSFGLRAPRQPRLQPRALGTDQVARLFLHADDRMRVVLLLEVQEGLRVGEVAGLTTDLVDLEERVLFVTGKGGHQRFVPLSEETAKAIDRYLTVCPAGPGMPLIRSYVRPARGVSAGYLGAEVSKLMAAAGVKRGPGDGKSGHALRHTAAKDILDRGADLRDVQEFLGHARLATTANVYAQRQLATSRIKEIADGRTYQS